MKVVTGGLGTIGTPLVLKLLESDSVCIVDNKSSCNPNNYELLRNCNRYDHELLIIEEDICRLAEIDIEFDQLYNLACPASPVNYKKDPLGVLRTCTDGMFNMIYICKRHGAKMLFTSTSEVYGNPTVNPQYEEYCGNVNHLGVRGCYDEGKRCAETILVNSGINYSIARVFNTYSRYSAENDGRVLPEFIRCAKANEPLRIHGTGNHTRSFTHVDDTIDALFKLMDSDCKTPVNIGNPNTEISINELAKLVIGITGSRSQIVHEPDDEDDPVWRRPYIKLAETLLNWSPKIDLHDGIKSLI
jgi:UDP-glucuronate decarboxylase